MADHDDDTKVHLISTHLTSKTEEDVVAPQTSTAAVKHEDPKNSHENPEGDKLLDQNDEAFTTSPNIPHTCSSWINSLHSPQRDLISIFVVAFDSKEGNLLEWYKPHELALDGVEFRALISGAHTVTSDFIIFRQGDYYGVACYEKLAIISDVERGARMKSVGVIVSSYNSIHHHLDYLAQQVRKMLAKPCDYSALEEYYQTRKAFIPTSWDTPQKVTNTLPSVVTQNLVAGPGEGFAQLFHLLGDQLVTLWKASLLCKRILLFSTPPIGQVCLRVYCISLLSSHSTLGLPAQLLRPLFYISLADMDLLQEQHSYVACTAEKIFEEKTGVCDIFVENGNVRVPVTLRQLLVITPEDRRRLASLQNLTQSPHTSITHCKEFFSELNNNIFAIMYDVCNSDKGVLEDDDIRAMSLNPQQDKAFLRELAITHGFDVTIREAQNCCCPCRS